MGLGGIVAEVAVFHLECGAKIFWVRTFMVLAGATIWWPIGAKKFRGGLYISETTALMVGILIPILIIFGIFGNMICFTVLRPTARKSTASFYLCCLAIFDSLCLFFSGLSLLFGIMWPSLALHYKLPSALIHKYIGWPYGMCKIRLYVAFVSRTISVWTIVIFTVERTIVIMSPLRGGIFCTMKKAVIAIIVIVVLSLPLNTFALYSFDKKTIKKGNFTQDICIINKHFIYINFVDMLILTTIPGVIILCCNVFIIRSLRRKSHQRREMCHDQSMTSQNAARDSEITKRLLLVSTAFIVCTFPLQVFTFVRNGYFFTCRMSTRVPPLTDFLAWFLLLFHVNSAINFMLYTLTSHQFRHGVVGLFTCSKQHLAIAREKNCHGDRHCKLVRTKNTPSTPLMDSKTATTLLKTGSSEPELNKILSKDRKNAHLTPTAVVRHPMKQTRSMDDILDERKPLRFDNLRKGDEEDPDYLDIGDADSFFSKSEILPIKQANDSTVNMLNLQD